ncbi:MAG TPA: RIO1 family regulatory kinase/ATPase [Streptosporangiaceae bacterium]|nr:RIO1 family regulatory kinase/ATPase [Streptosporangiaceae bacterium]
MPDRMADQAFSRHRRRKRRFNDDDQPVFAKRDPHRRRLLPDDAFDAVDGLPDGDRWSTWDQSSPSERGPEPHPGWLVTDLGATDAELGILKTGKEADVFLLRRAVPDTGRSCLLAAKRYRAAENRLFHRDVEYLDGRRVRESRDNRAMAKRTATGRAIVAQQWAKAELSALSALHQAGVPVPYPVQVTGTELLLEFIGEPDGTAAPRLAETRPRGEDLANVWDQLVAAVSVMARLGLAHGDLSAYNVLVHRGRAVLIDLPQVIDVIAHPRGPELLDRDAANIARWFSARGLNAGAVPPSDLGALLRAEARV